MRWRRQCGEDRAAQRGGVSGNAKRRRLETVREMFVCVLCSVHCVCIGKKAAGRRA